MVNNNIVTVCRILMSAVSVTVFGVVQKKLIVKKRVTYACGPNTYQEFFTILRTKLGVKRVRLLLPEADTYLKLLIFPRGTLLTRDFVIQKAQEIIPETIEDGFVDWKKVRMPGDMVGAQVYVVKKASLFPLLSAAGAAGVVIEACEPPSFAMARVAQSVPQPFILAYPAVNPEFLCAVQEGKVLEVMSVDPGALEAAKRTFLAYIVKTWGIRVEAIANNIPDPVFGLAAKTQLKGSDANILNIPTSIELSQNKRNVRTFMIGIFAIGVFALLIISVRYAVQRKKPISVVPSQGSASARVSPRPAQISPQIIRKDIRIDVQNGSGVAGTAVSGKKSLEDAGYSLVTTGNADTFDYTGVTVKAQTASVSAFVTADMRKIYPAATSSSLLLDNTSAFDAIVVIGKE